MQTVLYDGTFEGWLCAVFDVYEYKFEDVSICTENSFNGNIFEKVHTAHDNKKHSLRVWKGLQKRVSAATLHQLYRAFLSGQEGMETVLLRYVQYVFSTTASIETDFSHPDVLTVTQTAKKVWREKHRMEAFVRFQKTADEIYYAVIEPVYNVLPLISTHFENRYPDQQWLIYDQRRRFGIFYNKTFCSEVTLEFTHDIYRDKSVRSCFDEKEKIYQHLWQAYYKNANIPARKNTKLHLQHMPRRYWKYLPEKIKGEGPKF